MEDRSNELKESGLSEGEATNIATRILGPPQLVARQMYEVYSQGTWRQSLCAGMPHLLIALLFALHFWENVLSLAIVLFLVVSVTIYGWCHGRPDWLFPWLGYSLVPVIATGALLIYLPGAWSWFAILAYAPLVIFVIIFLTKASLKRDWLFASLMLLPLPITIGWVIALLGNTSLLWKEQVQHFAPMIALSFSVLAIAAAAFIRMKQRWAKFGTLIVLEAIVFIMIVHVGKSSVSPAAWLLIALFGLFLLLSPALLEQNIARNHSKPA